MKRIRAEKRIDETMTNEAKNKIQNHRTNLQTHYGFLADPKLSRHENLLQTISNMQADVYFSTPTNRQSHNLLDYGEPPGRLRSLLGLGLNFCIKYDRPTNKIHKTFERLRRDVRRINFWNNHLSDSEYNPKLYVSQEKWFDEAPIEVENGINAFEEEYRRLQIRYHKRTMPNLSNAQLELAAKQKLNDWTIVVAADKNLGPCILHRETYLKRAFEEHLGDFETYAVLDDRSCATMMSLLRQTQVLWLSKFDSVLPKGDKRYLKVTREKAMNKLAKFRMTMKVHKDPWKTRPIVCCTGTFMNAWSKWLDHYLRMLTPFVRTYTRDTSTVLEFIRNVDELPPTAMLFTADAESMYTNIDTDHAVNVISNWLDKIKEEPGFPKNWPLDAVKEAMSTIMRFNIFEFGNLKIHQLRGTAMGTSSACIWATIYFAIYENDYILPKYEQHLCKRNMLRFIDDIFGIWIFHEGRNDATCPVWNEFKTDLNSYGRLRWNVTKPSTHAVFLDLNLNIVGNRIRTSTYQKPMNLYLYIPGSSAHTLGMIKGTIYGQLLRYYEHNSEYSDYINYACLLYKRLLYRGHRQRIIKPIFLEAHKSILARSRTTQPDSADDNEEKKHLYLHFTYHPEDVPRKTIRKLYNKHIRDFEEELILDGSIIAYSRPTNLGELTSQAKLHEKQGRDAKTHLAEYTDRNGLTPQPTGLRRGRIPTVSLSNRPTAPPTRNVREGGS